MSHIYAIQFMEESCLKPQHDRFSWSTALPTKCQWNNPISVRGRLTSSALGRNIPLGQQHNYRGKKFYNEKKRAQIQHCSGNNGEVSSVNLRGRDQIAKLENK